MTTVIMTSNKTGETTTFQFDENGWLISKVYSNALNQKGYEWFRENEPYHHSMIAALKLEAKNSTFTETKTTVTFDMMWDRHNDKARSSKKKAKACWDKFPYEQQVKAYYYWPTYNRNRGNAEKKYLETYLNAQLWNN